MGGIGNPGGTVIVGRKKNGKFRGIPILGIDRSGGIGGTGIPGGIARLGNLNIGKLHRLTSEIPPS